MNAPTPNQGRLPVVLCSFDDAYAAQFARALERSCPVIHVSPLQSTAVTTIESMRPELVIIDLHAVKTEGHTIFELTRMIGDRFPAVRKIAVGHQSVPDEVIAAMKAGACDFLDRSASPNEIEETILGQLFQISSREQSRSGNVVAIAGAKPSEAETFLASNLAAHLASSNPEQSVLLLDLDLDCTELPIDFDVEITYSLHDAMEDQLRLERSMLERVLARHKSGLYLLPLALKRDSNDEISPQALATIVSSLRPLFDAVVIHASCFRHELCRSYLLPLCDHVIVVVFQQIGSIRAAHELFGRLGPIDATPRIQLVIADYDDDIDMPQFKLARHAGIPVLATLPTARSDLSTSHNRGAPLVLSDPKSPYARSVVNLAKQIAPGASSPLPAAGLGAKLKSLLRVGIN